ncbi:hypothetical protein LINPERHAP1_LOCUS19620 [Linum perenne]
MCCRIALLLLPPGSYWPFLLTILHFFRHHFCLGSRISSGDLSLACCSGSLAGSFGVTAMTGCSTASSLLQLP